MVYKIGKSDKIFLKQWIIMFTKLTLKKTQFLKFNYVDHPFQFLTTILHHQTSYTWPQNLHQTVKKNQKTKEQIDD